MKRDIVRFLVLFCMFFGAVSVVYALGNLCPLALLTAALLFLVAGLLVCAFDLDNHSSNFMYYP